MSREVELATALTTLSQRLVTSCRAAGRNPEDVTLLPVTKFFPAGDVDILYRLGCRAFGESREQEATAKVAELMSLPDMRWHMIGRLQRNKLRAIARWVDTVHSVDSVRLAESLDASAAAALDAGQRHSSVRVLVQVSVDGDSTRGGIIGSQLAAVADTVAAASTLRLAGVMAVAPLGMESERAFAELARIHEELLKNHPEAVERSAGMSGDLEKAVEFGSTCVRVGTALMGARPIISPW